MKKPVLHIALTLLIVFFAVGCSLKKNTWSTRTYHAINTRFNVYFNGQTSYDEGIKSIQKANVEDYSKVLPMYPISKAENAKVAVSNMDRTIEKCRKAIKLHSIKKKPIHNSRKAGNPEYKLFYNQEEYNPALKDAWLLLARAEFHKGDFLGSVGTFSYIARHYSTDREMIAQCQLWMVRAYAEMGWIYEAEQLLSKISQNDITYKLTPLYTSVNADLLIKKQQYKEAIPFLEISLSREKDKYQKQRFTFILAQLYQRKGDNKTAFETYKKVLKMSPPYDMDFNARLNIIELSSNVAEVRKDIKKMIKNPNNKDYLDQLYYVNGKTFLQKGDTVKALENFALSVENSTRKGIEKAISLITMGDLYYLRQEYVKAQPCYDEASKIINNEHADYKRVSGRALSLGELVTQYETVVLQDSLQKLSKLPEEKQMEIVKKLIEKLIADEKAEAEKKEQSENNDPGFTGFDPENMPAPVNNNRAGSAGDWYFYNPTLIKSGQQDFQKKWGKRKLEDNWRRINKSSVLFADNKENNVSNTEENAVKDSTVVSQNENKEIVTDNKDPQFYLQQIPVTTEQIEKSNADIADAMFKMGYIYKDKVEDYAISARTFENFVTRFPQDERVPEALYQLYLLNLMMDKTDNAAAIRTRIRKDYPDTKYSTLLSNPDFLGVREEMLKVQDSIYNLTYQAFNRSDFATVKANTKEFIKKYPQSDILPKFMFINALSIGKTETQDNFANALDELVELYPESDVSSMSKDILALMKQGKESRKGSSQGSLLARRDAEINTGDTTVTQRTFSPVKQTRHRLLLTIPADKDFSNQLLYSIAAFNFSRFMVKDFDIVTGSVDSLRNSLSVTGFETYDETSWYLNSVMNDSILKRILNNPEVQKIIISEENYGLLKSGFSLDDYLAYHNEKIKSQINPETVNVASVTSKTPTVKPVKETVKPAKETVKPSVATKLPEKEQIKPEIPRGDEILDKEYVEKAMNVIPDKSVVTLPQSGNTTSNGTATPATKQNELEVPLFKNLFAYKVSEPHFIAVAILSGTPDFDKTKALFDKYNTDNYGVMNLKVSYETIGKMKFIIVGQFNDANVAKSYLLRMVRERSLFQNMNDASYRNLVGTQNNLNVMVQENALSIYLEFMKEYYLK